jgi:long-subunit fatty acid transport protein
MRGRSRAAAPLVMILLVGAACGPAFAQSVFGINFLGENQFPGSARYRSLGLSSYAALDSVSAISANPAAMADLARLTFSMVEIVGLSNVRTTDATAYENRFQMPSVMLGVPLRKGIVFGIGYRTRFEGKGAFSCERPIEGADGV